MRVALLIAALVALLLPAPARAAEPFSLSPQPSQVFVGEDRKWTKWNVLAPGGTVYIDVSEPAELSVSIRRLFGASQKGAGASAAVSFGPAAAPSPLRLSNERSGAVIHKSNDTTGAPRTLRQRIAQPGRFVLRSAADAGPVLFLVTGVPFKPVQEEQVAVQTTPAATGKPAFVKPAVPAEKQPVAEENKAKFFVEPRPGFFVGKGTFTGFRGELAAGYIPGWLDGMLAIVVQGGYYGATAEQKMTDKDIGVITRNWDLTAIPVGAIVRWSFLPGDVQPYVGGGFDYTRVSFEYTASIPAGSLQEPKTTGLNSFLGPRGAAGVTWALGPGHLNGELAMTYAYLPQDAQGNASEILAPVVFAGYAYAF